MSSVGVPRVVGTTRAIALLGEVWNHGGTAIGLGIGVGVWVLCWVSLRIGRVAELYLDVSPTA